MPSLLLRPILGGEVAPKDVALDIVEPESIDSNSRRMLDLEFDIAEMAIATYAKARQQGIPLIALPLFTSGRRFVQPGFQVAARSGIRDLSELRGRTVAAPQYWMSSSIWQRQILQEMYGVAPEDMTWVTLQPERMSALHIPAAVEHRLDTSGRTARELAEQGEIDASLTPGGGPARPPGEPDSLVPAYPDRRAAQRAYYERTGIFPIMHITVVKQELVDRQPHVVESLCDAYARAKQIVQVWRGPTRSESPSAGETTEEMVELMGDDPWAYGIGPNRKALEAFVQTACDQELVDRKFEVEELFAANLPAAFR